MSPTSYQTAPPRDQGNYRQKSGVCQVFFAYSIGKAKIEEEGGLTEILIHPDGLKVEKYRGGQKLLDYYVILL